MKISYAAAYWERRVFMRTTLKVFKPFSEEKNENNAANGLCGNQCSNLIESKHDGAQLFTDEDIQSWHDLLPDLASRLIESIKFNEDISQLIKLYKINISAAKECEKAIKSSKNKNDGLKSQLKLLMEGCILLKEKLEQNASSIHDIGY